MVVGVKRRLNQFLIIGAEVGARYTFTDNLDASNPIKSNISQQLDVDFGNIFSDDWYVFSMRTECAPFGVRLKAQLKLVLNTLPFILFLLKTGKDPSLKSIP